MTAAVRDAGLSRSVGTWGLAASIVNMVVGASIFVIPATLAANAGTYAPVAMLLAAVAVAAVAVCFAEGGSRIATSGGAYGYIEAAFGPLAGYIAGTLLWFSDVMACGGIAAAMADVIVTLLPPGARFVAHTAIIVAAIAGITFVNLGGVARGMRLVNATTALKLLPLGIFIAVGAWFMHGENFRAPTSLVGTGLGRAMILAVFAFTGMETSLCASGEVRHPERTIPRALALALGLAIPLFVAIQLVAQGILGDALATSSVPLGDAMARINPDLRLLMVAGTGVSMFGYLSCDILSSPRILFAFARDGLLPRMLGRVHERTRVPHVALMCYAALALVFALTGTFAELAVLSALATAAFYIAGSAAAWFLVRRGIAQAGTPLGFRWLGPAAFVGIASMLALIALASKAEIIGLGVLIVITVTVFFVQKKWQRGREGAPSRRSP